MNTPPPDDRSSVAVAYAWAWRIVTISMEMVIPGLVGLVLDRWLGTLVLFTILGFGAGMTLGIWHLVKLPPAGGRPPYTSSRADFRKDDRS